MKKISHHFYRKPLPKVAVFLGLCLGLVTGFKPVKAATLEVIASDLVNPRGITFDANGALYVTEAGLGPGIGGTGPVIDGPVPGVTLTYGPSGAITKVENGTQERIVTKQASVLLNEGGANFGNGPTSIDFDANGDAYVTIGYSGFPNLRDDLGPEAADLGQLIKFQIKADGSWVRDPSFFSDLATYEDLNNPDGTDIVSNPYLLKIQGDQILTIDAAGNDLLSVDKNTGNISLIAVFPPGEVDPNFGFPPQSVPTSLAIGPDGAYYVSELVGFPYPEGEARIFRVVPGEEPEVYANDFTHVNGLEFDSEGNLYVLEYTEESLSSSTNELLSSITRLSPDGDREIIVSPGEGLVGATGLTLGPDGNLYTANYSSLGEEGEVVRISDFGDETETIPESSAVFGLLAVASLGLLARKNS